MPPLRLGLFGGTFDPPHIGHLLVAQDVVEGLALDRLLFVPAGIPPHKEREDLTPAPIRLQMVKAAVQGNDTLGVSEVELGREGPSFTVDTLRHFRGMHPDGDLFFLMGADQVTEFQDWQDPEDVAELATLVAFTRDGAAPSTLSSKTLTSGAEVNFKQMPVTRIDISSTDIRERVEHGRSIQYLVPDDVRRIIESHRLYRSVT